MAARAAEVNTMVTAMELECKAIEEQCLAQEAASHGCGVGSGNALSNGGGGDGGGGGGVASGSMGVLGVHGGGANAGGGRVGGGAGLDKQLDSPNSVAHEIVLSQMSDL
jgi:hypothetical protein